MEVVKEEVQYVPQVFSVKIDESMMEARPELAKQGLKIGDIKVMRVVIAEDIAKFNLSQEALGEWLLNEKFEGDPLSTLEDGEEMRVVISLKQNGEITMLGVKQEGEPSPIEVIGLIELAKHSVTASASSSEATPPQEEFVPYTIDQDDETMMTKEGLAAQGLKIGDVIPMPRRQYDTMMAAKSSMLQALKTTTNEA